jgi:aryl-alcohol dehydrogenase-like predicted oxidoreductase
VIDPLLFTLHGVPVVQKGARGLALGTMNFGKRTPAAESESIIARAIERGVTFIDTANAYVDGESERIVGRAIRGKRDKVTIATKVGFGRVDGRPEGLSRARIHAAIDDSLKRLGMDEVDVYYLHVPDHAVPIEESLSAMEELVRAGKTRAVGVSNYAAWQILDMMQLSEPGRSPAPVVSQVLYNLLIREIEIEYAAFTRAHPIHTTVFNPLAGGLLSGKHARGASAAKGSRFDKNRLYEGRYWSDRFFDLVDAYGAIARDEGMSLVDLSYAWIAGQPHVDSIILGPASVEHLDAGIDACAKTVSPEARARIDGIHRGYLGTESSYVR